MPARRPEVRTIFLATILLSAAPVRADLGTTIRNSPFLRSAAFRAVQLRLCNDYRPRAAFSACWRAGAALRELISFNRPLTVAERARLAAGSGVPAAEATAVTAIHVDRLAALLRDPATAVYLKDLAFTRRYDAENFNLWETSRKISTRPEFALERVAVLFQDLSQAREHIHWAIAKGMPEAAIDTLVATTEPLIAELKIGVVGAEHPAREIAKYYPDAVAERALDSLSPGAYHFYSAAYWTDRLMRAGFSREDAVLQAFGVHLAYEISSQNKNLWPAGHLPEKLSSLYKAQDLASAYLGALYGDSIAGETAFRAEPGLASAFLGGFRSSVRRLFKTRP